MQIDSKKVCNEQTTATETTFLEGEGFDFAAHMKTVRPTFNRFGQHEPATVSYIHKSMTVRVETVSYIHKSLIVMIVKRSCIYKSMLGMIIKRSCTHKSMMVMIMTVSCIHKSMVVSYSRYD